VGIKQQIILGIRMEKMIIGVSTVITKICFYKFNNIYKFMEEKDKKYPEGHFKKLWMGIGIAIFSMFGIPLSIATGSYGFIGIGPAIGVSFGLAIGQSIENKYKKEGKIRPLTEEEQNRKKIGVLAGIFILTIGVFLAVML
jgi:hypothetical protein